MQPFRGSALTVAVRLMAEPCLWQCEIRDTSRDEVVANSWSNEWMGYESPAEAYRAGQARLGTIIPH